VVDVEHGVPCAARAAAPAGQPWAWALVLAVLYASTDEFHQGFVAGRHESALDVGIDAAGALIAVVAVGIIWARRV